MPRLNQTLALLLLTSGSLVAWPRAGAAQVPAEGELQLVTPSPYPSAVLDVPLGSTAGHGVVRSGFWVNGARSLLRTEIADGSVALGDVVQNRLDIQGYLGLALWRRLELGVGFAGTAYQDGLNTSLVRQLVGKDSLQQNGLNDLHLGLKGTLVEEDDYLPALALVVEGTVPTGSEREFLGEAAYTVSPSLALSKRVERTMWAFNVGYRYRPESMHVAGADIESEIFYRLAMSYRVQQPGSPSVWNLLFGFLGHTAARDPFGLVDKDRPAFHNSGELFLGTERSVSTTIGSFKFLAGLGTGVMSGYGSARLRGILGIDYINAEPTADNDGDGLLNAQDQCPNGAEDEDDFEDEDGCPDLDNDQDGVPDDDDECPVAAEDRDNFEDSDGCPEQTDEDTDRDGVSDATDRCPTDKEDLDGFQDDDGCPDVDNDGDGLSDLNDLCPDEFEDQTTSADKDGCPDKVNRDFARLGANAIHLLEPVRFLTGRPQVAPESKPVLNQVATILKSHPKLHVRILVSPEGTKPAALKAADRRAQAIVTFLVARGIAASRLSAAGLDKPSGGDVAVRVSIVR